MNELDIQTQLVDAGNELGGHCFKAANRFKKGIPDLSMQVPKFVHAYIEVKFERRFSRGDRIKRPDLSRDELRALGNQRAVKVALTPHQRRFIKEHSEAGGCAGWLMVVGVDGRGTYAMTSSLRLPSHGVLYWLGREDSGWFIKERGGKWPIEKIMRSLQH